MRKRKLSLGKDADIAGTLKVENIQVLLKSKVRADKLANTMFISN